MNAEFPVRKAILIGHPVSHARSPRLHRFWLDELKIAGAYESADVLPGDVNAFLRALPAQGFVGGNVTVPHKEAAFQAADWASPRASLCKAANTFWFENGRLCCDNTDGIGFVGHLDQTYPGWDRLPQTILILGAGGAARGLIAPLLGRNVARLIVVNRSRERAEALIKDLAMPASDDASATIAIERLHIGDWSARAALLGQTSLLINATSLGMAKGEILDLPLDTLAAQAIVADLVYVPLQTPLLAQAARRGLRCLDGLGMLLHQGVPGFERWFGQKPSVSAALRAHMLADLTPGNV